MSIWNPLVFTPTGRPVGPVAPPSLRVYGGNATAAQVAMAQGAFQNFTASARLSAVSNPTAIGALPDGTRYRIFVVGQQTIMEIWPVGAGDSPMNVFSGIYFHNKKWVLVNEGGNDLPGPKWKIVDVSAMSLSPNYFEPVSRNLLPYNINAAVNISTILPKPLRYVYQGGGEGWQIVGRYGVAYAYFAAPIGLSSDSSRAIGLVYGSYSGSPTGWYAVQSKRVNLSSLFLKPGSLAPPSPPTLEEDSDLRTFLAGPVSGATNIEVSAPSVRKDGRRIVFKEDSYGGAYTPADADVLFSVARRDSTAASINTSNGAILVPSTTVYMGYRDRATKVVAFARPGDSFVGPTTEYTVPADQISAKGLYYGIWDSARTALATSSEVGVKVVHKSAPTFSIIAEWIGNADSADPKHMGSEQIAGPISGRLTRSEVTHDCTPHYVGSSYVLLQRTRSVNYEATCEGSVDYKYLEGVYDFVSTHTGPHIPGTLTEAKERHLISSQELFAELEIEEYYTLNDGRRLYLEKYKYEENGTDDVEFHSVLTDPSTPDYGSFNRAMTYTVNREQRALLVYDPKNELLCFTECTFQTTKSFSLLSTWEGNPPATTSYTNSGGGSPPSPPTPEVVIQCRGIEIRIPMPFRTSDFRLATLLPATGISPYAPVNGALLTTQAFPGWSMAISVGLPQFLPGDAFVFDGEARSGDANITALRGRAPRMAVAVPEVEYIKTPETGGGYLRVWLFQDGARLFDHTYLVDSKGVRPINNVLPSFDVGRQKGVPF